MTKDNLPPKEYIGDGAYVAHDGYHVVLTAENGIFATDTVVLEPSVLRSFIKWLKDNNLHPDG